MTLRFLAEMNEVGEPLAKKGNTGIRTNWRGNRSFILDVKSARIWKTQAELHNRLLLDESGSGWTYRCEKQ